MNEKLTAILKQPNFQPVLVEITDADKETGKAWVTTPGGLEVYVNFQDLTCVEGTDAEGKLTFYGDPKIDEPTEPTLLDALTAPVIEYVQDNKTTWNTDDAPPTYRAVWDDSPDSVKFVRK